MAQHSANAMPCPGCRALTAELNRERRELRNEANELAAQLRALRRVLRAVLQWPTGERSPDSALCAALEKATVTRLG